MTWTIFTYFLTGITGAAIAYTVKYFYDKRLERRKTQARIVCSPSCHPFLNADANQTGHTVELIVDGEKVENAALFYFRLKNQSQIIARNVKVRVELKPGIKFLSYFFMVQQQVVCERLDTDHSTSPPKFNWAYINPGEVIDLEIVVVPFLGPDDVSIELDGEYLHLEAKPVQTNCAVPSRG